MTDLVRITSRDNQHLKFARRVRDGNERKHIFIEGSRLCAEALRSGIRIESTFCTDAFYDSQAMNGFPQIEESQTFLVSDKALHSIADTAHPQGIVMLGVRPNQIGLKELFLEDRRAGRPQLWVFLFQTNNPVNLGAVIRTAEAAGVRGVIVSSGSSDPLSPGSLRASMGSAFRLPIVTAVETKACIELAKGGGIRTVAVDSKGANGYLDHEWRVPTLLIFGSEAGGLPNEVIELAGESVNIGIEPQVESLNLAVACGVVLFEARRQTNLS